ncbi:hypothetical protein FKM82_031035 [Ascaphus truei]
MQNSHCSLPLWQRRVRLFNYLYYHCIIIIFVYLPDDAEHCRELKMAAGRKRSHESDPGECGVAGVSLLLPLEVGKKPYAGPPLPSKHRLGKGIAALKLRGCVAAWRFRSYMCAMYLYTLQHGVLVFAERGVTQLLQCRGERRCYPPQAFCTTPPWRG